MTIDLLHTWLWRRWLGEAFFVERHHSNPAFAQDNMEMQYATCSRRDWRGEVNAKKQPFHLHWSVYRSSDSDLDGFMDGFIEAEQWYADRVNLYFVEQVPGLFADNLREWLKENYRYEVTPLQLTPDEQEEFDQASEDEKPSVVKRAKRRRDEHNQRAIDRIEAGEPEWEVRQDWIEEYYLAKRRYPEDTESGEDQLWRKNVLDHVDWEKANENRSRRENSAEK